METHEGRIAELRYLIQDLDTQISQTDIPVTEISSASQLAEMYAKKEVLVRQRDMRRKQIVELEVQRKLAKQEAEKKNDQQHRESTRLSKIAIGTDIILAVPWKSWFKSLFGRF